jgi:excisionase family DNA binding protein
MKEKKGYYSIAELAKKLDISRIAVFKRVQKGSIKAIRVGRSYAVPEEEVYALSEGVKADYGEDRGEIAIYQGKNGPEIEARIENLTVWLSQKQMAVLFNKGVPAVNEHIRNIFNEGELEESSVIRKFRTTASDGKSYDTNFYNLDVIISVGYRIRSKEGTAFRIWATGVIKDHLVRGYTLNEKQLEQSRAEIKELKKTIDRIVSGQRNS